ncbi:MAG: hypothetical protein ABI114_12665 [Rhodanobacter sp.]
MPNVLVQNIEGVLAERIYSLAKERQWSINEVMLYALRNGLGISAAQEFSETLRDPADGMTLDGHWESAESGAFQEALDALAQAPATQLSPERIRADAAASGEE